MKVETQILQPLTKLVIEPEKPKWPEWEVSGKILSVVKTDTEVIILGEPVDAPDDLTEEQFSQWYETAHNCDAMGCGWNHVLWRG